MGKTDSPLVAAAAAFDAELATYSRLGELFLKTPLNTLKHLERARETLQEISASETRLQEAGKQLITALGEARQRQEQLSASVIEHAPNVRGRSDVLANLMLSMGELAKDAASIKDAAAGDPAEISAKVMELSQRADDLATKCREADFAELGDQVHALHQRLKAVGQKLQKAAPN
jgi:hypothetical protein